MSIFEKVKKILRALRGNEQKLLKSQEKPKGSKPNNTSPRQKTMKDRIRFDLKNLLDPRVCRGDNFVPNILKSLGANEDVIKNPYAIEEISFIFQEIANQSGTEMPKHDEKPTKETIKAIVEAVKTNGILTSQDIVNRYDKLKAKTRKRYYGISIDQETGEVTLQDGMIAKRDCVRNNWKSHDRNNIYTRRKWKCC